MLSENHAFLVWSLNAVSTLHFTERDFVRSEQLAREALPKSVVVQSDRQTLVKFSLSNLIRALQNQDRAADALREVRVSSRSSKRASRSIPRF